MVCRIRTELLTLITTVAITFLWSNYREEQKTTKQTNKNPMATSEISTFIFIHIDNIPTGRLLKTSSRHPQATFLYIEKQISVV